MSALADRAVTDVRKIHLEMIDAVLAGGGVAPVAAIAAEQLRGTVAIVLGDVAVVEPPIPDGHRPRPVAEIPVRSGDEILGSVTLLDADDPHDAHEILELAAVAALTAVTLRDAGVTQRRATAAFLDELRSPRPPLSEEIVARGRRLGAYLAHGANMNATAIGVHAHRHTISSRLERVRALTGHDPQTPLGQAQLALGIQALDLQRKATGLSAG